MNTKFGLLSGSSHCKQFCFVFFTIIQPLYGNMLAVSQCSDLYYSAWACLSMCSIVLQYGQVTYGQLSGVTVSSMTFKNQTVYIISLFVLCIFFLFAIIPQVSMSKLFKIFC